MLRIEVQDLRSAPAPIQHSSLTHARLHPRETAPLDVTTPVTTGLSAQLFNHSELRKLSLSFKTILHSFLHLRPLQSEIYLLITAYAYICRHLTSLTQAIALHRHTIWTYSGATIGRMVKDVTRGAVLCSACSCMESLDLSATETLAMRGLARTPIFLTGQRSVRGALGESKTPSIYVPERFFCQRC